MLWQASHHNLRLVEQHQVLLLPAAACQSHWELLEVLLPQLLLLLQVSRGAAAELEQAATVLLLCHCAGMVAPTLELLLELLSTNLPFLGVLEFLPLCWTPACPAHPTYHWPLLETSLLQFAPQSLAAAASVLHPLGHVLPLPLPPYLDCNQLLPQWCSPLHLSQSPVWAPRWIQRS